jgi:prenyltransferase beta subunit
VAAAGGDPRAFAAQDLVVTLLGHRQPDGQFQAEVTDGAAAHSLALLALVATDEPVPASAPTWLLDQQNDDGSWSSLAGEPGDMRSTSLSVQALAAAGTLPSDLSLTDALAYIYSLQRSDAGFLAEASASSTSTASTGWALQALTAAGESLIDSHLKRSGQMPSETLLQRQHVDGGFVPEAGNAFPSVAATAVGVQGLIGKPLPYRGPHYAVRRALDWLDVQQLPDGSFGSGPVTADAVRSIALAGEDPNAAPWVHGENSAVEALENLLSTQPVMLNDAGQLGKTLRAVAEIGADPRSFGGYDLIAAMEQLYDPQSGWYHSGHAFKHALALEGLAAVGEPVPGAAVQALMGEQHADGGWGWPIGGDVSDNDTTGRVISSLLASGVEPTDAAFEAALDFLASRQLADGGWGGFLEDSPSNSNSAALVMEGILNLGERVVDPPFTLVSNQGVLVTPIDALLSFQEDSGAFAYTEELPESRLLAVLDSIPALETGHPGTDIPDLAIEVAQLDVRVAGPGHLQLLLPISGDGNGDAQATIRYRKHGDDPWGEANMDRHGVMFSKRLRELEPGATVDLEITVPDPDGVSGQATQSHQVTAPLGLWLPTVMR